MRIILDADILSTFLKINKIDLLKKLFDVAITQRVQILKSLWRLKIISKEEVEKIVEEIELKDKTKISNKELIFGDRV